MKAWGANEGVMTGAKLAWYAVVLIAKVIPGGGTGSAFRPMAVEQAGGVLLGSHQFRSGLLPFLAGHDGRYRSGHSPMMPALRGGDGLAAASNVQLKVAFSGPPG